MTSIVPPPDQPLTPYSKLLVQGSYTSSAPLHFCLSHLAGDASRRSRVLLLYCGSPETLENSLVDLNDTWLNENAGKGDVADRLSRIHIMQVLATDLEIQVLFNNTVA